VRTLATLVAALILALAGCGGDDASDTNTGVGDTGAATTEIPRTGTVDDTVETETPTETGE
jgi:hypothetical protein